MPSARRAARRLEHPRSPTSSLSLVPAQACTFRFVVFWDFVLFAIWAGSDGGVPARCTTGALGSVPHRSDQIAEQLSQWRAVCQRTAPMRGHPNTTGLSFSNTDTARQLETVRYRLTGNRNFAHNLDYPYHADQFARDVREWVAATEVEPKRHGQMLFFALRGVQQGGCPTI